MNNKNKELSKKSKNTKKVKEVKETKDVSKKYKKMCDSESSDSEYYSTDYSSSDDDDSDSDYYPSINSSRSQSSDDEDDDDDIENTPSFRKNKKVKNNKNKVSNTKQSIKPNTNNIIILSNYPNENYDELGYNDDEEDGYSSSESEIEDEDEEVSDSSSEEEDDNDDDKDVDDNSYVSEVTPPQKKRKINNNKSVGIVKNKVKKTSTDQLKQEKAAKDDIETNNISNMIGKDFKLSMDSLVTQNEESVRNTILNHFKEINKVVKDKMVDEQIQIYEKSMKKYNEKRERRNKKISDKHTRIFSKLIKTKTHTDDAKFYKNYPIEKQYEVIKRLREISKVSIVEKPYRLQLIESNIPVVYKSAAINKINQLKFMDPSSGEYCKLKNWIDLFMNIPFDKYSTLDVTRENSHDFLEKSYAILNNAVYGLDDAKIQLMQLMGQLIVNPSSIGCSIAINGPPGTGKTSLIKDGVSKILNRPFIFIPLGGATDASFLEGHSYTYEGSMCGKIIQSIVDCKCMNPVIYFDELDKISDSPRGAEILNLLVHITDTTQNCQFHDKYFRELEFDLSKCLFIFSYNEESNINPILLDRMYKIKTNGYSPKEKIHIVQNYLTPSIEKQLAFTNGDIIIKDDILLYIIEKFTLEEKGVRNIKRCIEIIYSKLNLFRLMKPENNIFKSQIDVNVSFPIEITKSHIDKLIKINVSQPLYKSMYI